MRSKNVFFSSFLLCITIHNTLAASFEKTTAPNSHYNEEKIYHKNPFQQVRAKMVTKKSTAITTTKTPTSIEIELNSMQCPVGCVCQYARFNDLPLSRWINYMQNSHSKTTASKNDNDYNNNDIDDEIYMPTNYNNNNNKKNNAAVEADEEKDDDDGDLTSNNPYIKQATCILQPDNDVPTLINMLPHDLQALILLYTGMAQNESINMSLLKPLNKLSTLEIRGSPERSLRLIFDEPLPFLLHANFEFVTLMGSNSALRPKSTKHPQDVFDYKPKSELQDGMLAMNVPGQLNELHIAQEVEEHLVILPYEAYVEEVKKIRMPHFFGWQQLLVLRVHACELKELHWEMFDGLDSLQHLSLERNSIDVVPPFTLYGVRNIKTLSLAHNFIHDLDYRDLAGLLELETLDLSHNRLHILSEKTFPPFPKLHHVDFRHNPIKYILPATFWIMNTTRYMYFDSNEDTLDLWNNAPFDSLRDLNILEIANISVDILQQNMFKGLTTLEKLRLRGKIHSIEFDAFASLINMRELYLSQCQINEISMDAFIGCKRLEVLDLSYNNISYLPVGLFDEQPMLEEIYLQHNQLRTLPTTFFLQAKLNLARLHDNPWECSCNMGNWLPRITNRLSTQRTERCIADYQTGKIISCKSFKSNNLDRSLAPRCDNHNGRSVFYVLRKQLQCNVMPKRNSNIKQHVPHWRKIQKEHLMRHTNSLNYALQPHNALDEYNIHKLGKTNNNNNNNSSNNNEEISNDI